MKNLIWLLFALIVLSCSRGEQIRVKGIVENAEGMIYLDEQGLREIHNIDSCKLNKKGNFALRDRIMVPTFYNLHLGKQSIIPLLIHPGETAEISTNLSGFSSDYKVSGSPESLYLLALNRTLASTKHSLDSLTLIFEANKDAGEEVLSGIQTARDEVIQSQRKSSIKFVIEHLNSMASIYALYQKIDDNNYILNSNRDIQLLKITSMALDTLYPESDYVQSLKRNAALLEQEMQNLNWQKVIEDAPSSFPEIRLPDPYGDTIALSSLKGKVILLSFWASWDESSVNLNLDLKAMYNKYHQRGFEIYQVSFDSELRPWMTAIQFDELDWIHVSELSFPESSVASIYNVTELPCFFLIDRQGEISGKDYNKTALDNKISELLNQNQ
jgi:peroxiredoxin